MPVTAEPPVSSTFITIKSSRRTRVESSEPHSKMW
jgi:hypothetical protein